MMRRLNVLLAVILCAFTATIARAESIMTASVVDLTHAADVVATGHVTTVTTGRDAATNWIYTYVTVDITEVLRGSVGDRTIVLQQLGGTVGDESMVIPEQAQFTAGEDVLLFAASRPRDGSLYTAQLWQGKWSIERDARTLARVATRVAPESDRGVFEQQIEQRDLAALLAQIRGAVATAPPVRIVRETVRPTRVQANDVASAPFTLYSNVPGRWNEFDTRSPIPVDIESNGQPAMPSGGVPQLINAFNLWSSATPLIFAPGNGVAHCKEDSHVSRHIQITFLDPCGEISDVDGTFAVAGYFCVTNGGVNLNGVPFCRNTGGFIINNNSAVTFNLYASSPSCFQAVQTHMIGHAMGLGHSADPSAIMYGTIQSSCRNGAPGLNADDVNGIRFIYPCPGCPAPGGGGSLTAPGTPGSLTFAAIRGNVTLTWTAPSGGGAATSYIVEAGSTSGSANLANFSTGSSAPTYSAQNVPAGRYFVRVRATNASGTSGPSNEVVIDVTP